MGLKCFRYGFSKKESDFWPTLSKRQEMPPGCKSKHNGRTAKLGLGLVEAVSVLLAGRVELGREGASFSISYQSNRGGTRVASSRSGEGSSGPGAPRRIWEGTDAMKAPIILCLVEAMLLETTPGGADSELAEVGGRWAALLEEIELETGEAAPYTKTQITRAAQSDLCQKAVMALTDGVYFALKRSEDEGTREFRDRGGSGFPALSGEDFDRLFDRPPAEATPEPMPEGYLTATLSGLIQTGGTALLVGPTGTFKTTTATRVAEAEGAALQVVKGRPGIEDRDFFGGVVPTGSGPAWRDGPVTKAFRKGRAEATMLLMDELLRFEPLFLGAFVGLLDPASPAELSARGIDPAPGFSGADHYVAELPTGEEVACPTRRLALVATTNMGSDYVQASRLDAALMGRFELTVEVERPDPDVKRHLYEEAAEDLPCAPVGSARLADLLEAVEETVEEGHIDKGGLYVRKAHPRLMLNMARQMKRILENPQLAGRGPAVAAQEAAAMTVVPNCVERQASGLLDPSGKDSLLQDVADCAEEVL